jgi:Fe-S oxidoreductase
MMRIKAFEEYLAGCRFCPMCKPFGEVSNITQDEAHSTRVRGMLLWQVAQQHHDYNAQISHLLYETTLDSASQAWCVSHYPVPDYILAARADLAEAGWAPEAVQDFRVSSGGAFAEQLTPLAAAGAQRVFYPGDALAAGTPDSSLAGLRLLAQAGQQVALPGGLPDTGGIAYCLGRQDLALEQAGKVREALQGWQAIAVDGPLTYWMLTQVYPRLGSPLADEISVQLLSTWLLELASQGKLSLPQRPGKAYATGSEFSRICGIGYQPLRQAFGALPGLALVEPVDGLELADASGVGGGLHIAAPELASRVSRKRVAEALQAGADWLVTDSALDAAHLKANAGQKIEVLTFEQLALEQPVPS